MWTAIAILSVIVAGLTGAVTILGFKLRKLNPKKLKTGPSTVQMALKIVQLERRLKALEQGQGMSKRIG